MNRKYLFITGAGRSGTTFFWRVLNNSPEVYLSTEIHYFSSLYHAGFLKNLKKLAGRTINLTFDDVFRSVQSTENFGIYWRETSHFTRSETREYFRDKHINENNIYIYLMEHDYRAAARDKINVKYIGEKTPINIFHLRKLFKWFPEAKILFLFRNPIDVLKSEVNKRNKPDYPLNKENTLYVYGLVVFVFFEWLLAAVIAFCNKAMHKDKFIIISYEFLTSRQELTVYRICSAIGIEYSAGFCEFKKMDSSYSTVGKKPHWYPPKWIVLLYTLFLSPLGCLLNRVSINNRPPRPRVKWIAF